MKESLDSPAKKTDTVTVPFDEDFDWDALWNDHNFRIEDHPELWDNLATHKYLRQLGLKISDLKGGKLLDIGSEASSFVRVAVSQGINAVALDTAVHPALLEKTTPFVRGDAVRLPFADDTFDWIVSNAGPLQNIQWFGTGDQADQLGPYPAIAEAIRVLKSGGEIRFPFSTNQRPDLFNRNEASMRFIETLRSLPNVEFIQQESARDTKVRVYANKEDAKAKKLTDILQDNYLFILRKG